MGQYFIAVNRDKQESCSLQVAKIGAALANSASGIFPYLLASGPQDGTVLARGMEDDDELRENALEEYENMEESKQEFYQDEDGEINVRRLVDGVEARRDFAEANEYAGRWAGDDCAVIGDYTNQEMLVDGEPVSLYTASSGTVTRIEKVKNPDSDEPEVETIYWSGDIDQDELDEKSTSYQTYERLSVHDTGWTDITEDVFEEAKWRVGSAVFGLDGE